MVLAAGCLKSHQVRIGEAREDHQAAIISQASHQLFPAPLPLQTPPPIPCCLCRVQFRGDVLQSHRWRALFLVALPIRVLACSPAVTGLLAARAALEPRTLLAAVGASLHARRHRRGRGARERSLPPAPPPLGRLPASRAPLHPQGPGEEGATSLRKYTGYELSKLK